MGDKSYNKTFIHEGEKIARSPTKTKLKVTNLKPGTHYRFQVATNAGCGKALYSAKVEATTDFDGKLFSKRLFLINVVSQCCVLSESFHILKDRYHLPKCFAYYQF